MECAFFIPFLTLNLKCLCGGNHSHPGFPWEWRGMGKHVSQADAGAERVGKGMGIWRGIGYSSVGNRPLGAETALANTLVICSRAVSNSWVWCQRSSMSHGDFHISHFKRIKIVPHFHRGAFSCHVQSVSLSGNISAAPGTLHSSCACKRRKLGKEGVNAGTRLKCFQAGWLR